MTPPAKKISLLYRLKYMLVVGAFIVPASISVTWAQTPPGHTPMKLASTRIVTKNVPALAAFYEKVTEIAPVGTDTYVEIRTPGSVLAIADEESVKKSNAGAAVGAANHSVILEFEVADVDVERARLNSFITHWVLEPTDQPWGNRSMLFRDPDGNLINFYTPIRPPK